MIPFGAYGRPRLQHLTRNPMHQPPCISHLGHLEGEQPYFRGLINHGYHQLQLPLLTPRPRTSPWVQPARPKIEELGNASESSQISADSTVESRSSQKKSRKNLTFRETCWLLNRDPLWHGFLKKSLKTLKKPVPYIYIYPKQLGSFNCSVESTVPIIEFWANLAFRSTR